MSKAIAVVALIAVAIAAAGPAQAMRTHARSMSYAHFPTCAAGLVKAICVCRATNGSRRIGLCPSRHYCHPYDGACTQ